MMAAKHVMLIDTRQSPLEATWTLMQTGREGSSGDDNNAQDVEHHTDPQQSASLTCPEPKTIGFGSATTPTTGRNAAVVAVLLVSFVRR